jgi:hypothetical protein
MRTGSVKGAVINRQAAEIAAPSTRAIALSMARIFMWLVGSSVLGFGHFFTYF